MWKSFPSLPFKVTLPGDHAEMCPSPAPSQYVYLHIYIHRHIPRIFFLIPRIFKAKAPHFCVFLQKSASWERPHSLSGCKERYLSSHRNLCSCIFVTALRLLGFRCGKLPATREDLCRESNGLIRFAFYHGKADWPHGAPGPEESCKEDMDASGMQGLEGRRGNGKGGGEGGCWWRGSGWDWGRVFLFYLLGRR